jgi:hypothetical protein
MSAMQCKVCAAPVGVVGEFAVRRRYNAKLFQCTECGFAFFPEPAWLSEAYHSPINVEDVGYLKRNAEAASMMATWLPAISREDDYFLDYGAGYGVLVRTMRDLGFQFQWMDKYSTNLFARGFEADESLAGQYRAVASVEVFEHLENPKQELKSMLHYANTVLFTTQLIPASGISADWDYLGLTHGQHISFYTANALRFLASERGLHYLELPFNWHVIGDSDTLSKIQTARLPRFGRIKGYLVRLLGSAAPRRSLTDADFTQITSRQSERLDESADTILRQSTNAEIAHVEDTRVTR